MSTMTVSQFKRYIGTVPYSRIIFCSDNQNWDHVGSPINLCLTFGVLSVTLNPNIICLKSGDNTVCFERIKSVDTDVSVLGVVINVICEDDAGEICYTLVAS